jgi:transposase
MPRAYSVDLRERTLRARDAGLTAAEVERLLGISPRTQQRWRSAAATPGGLAPRRSPGRPPKLGPAAAAALAAQVAAAPDATLAAHCARWAAAGGVRVSTATMSRRLARLGLPLKKRP